MGGTHGSAIPYIVMDDIVKFIINYDKKVFDDLSKIMKLYVLQIQDNENQNEKLAELRETLLPKLMNGEIEVGWAWILKNLHKTIILLPKYTWLFLR